MDPRVRGAIARVDVVRDGLVVSRGTGCLVGERLVLTARHVVADRATDSQRALGEIHLTFAEPPPEMGGDPSPTHEAHTVARVFLRNGDATQDWALLECDVAPSPDAQPLSLGTLTHDRDGWETYGFPDAHPTGMVCRGTIEHRDDTHAGARVHQLFCLQAAAGDGMPVKGLSGAPVVVGGAVVGVLRSSLLATEDDADGKPVHKNVGGTLYACPATVIAGACPKEFPEPLRDVSTTPRPKRWLAAVAAVIVLAVGALGYFWLRSDPWVSQLIVIDTSDGMGAEFPGGPTKVAAAVSALNERTLLPDDNLALRTYGGECDRDDSTRVLVRWGTNRTDAINRATQNGLRVGGQPTLVRTLAAAITDVARFRNTRRIIVLTGGDKCPNEDLNEISFRLKAHAMTPEDLDVRLIGLGVSPEKEAWLKKVAKTVNGEVYVAQNTVQLNQMLEWLMSVQPAVKQVQEVWKIVDGVGKTANQFIGQVNARKYDEAERSLDEARTTYSDRTNRRKFEEFARDVPSEKFKKFYGLASNNRVLQEQFFTVGAALLREGKASGKEQSQKLRDTISTWNGVIQKYNVNINNMNELTQQIVKEGRYPLQR